MRRITITNSLRPESIGDCISAFPAVRALGDQERVGVFFSCEQVWPLFSHPNVSLLHRQEHGSDVFDVQPIARLGQARGWHLAQCWFAALGLDLPPPRGFDFGITPRWVGGGTDVVLSPFSASDGGGMKTWPADRWAALVSELGVFTIVCGIEDNRPAWLNSWGRFVQGYSLRKICDELCAARGVITIDNGISWLAQAVRAPHILLQSSNHATWWTPDPNPCAINLPDVRTATVEQVLAAVDRLMG